VQKDKERSMQKRSIFVGQCSKGHDVHVTHDLDENIDGGTIGIDVVTPLPDGTAGHPIVVACDECAKKVYERIASKS
jgi:hypothetical protein